VIETTVYPTSKSILSHLELHSVKPEAKKQFKAKNTYQTSLPKRNTPQTDLSADF
jgi:hypothetical protein